jgi:hypothetical protein
MWGGATSHAVLLLRCICLKKSTGFAGDFFQNGTGQK